MDKLGKFLEKVKKTHGESVDTSKVEYIDSKTKVCLICHKKDKYGNEHGEYWQTPAACVRGNICPKCANERRGKRLEDRMTTEKYILKEREIFGYKYDLSKIQYIDAKTKMCFICPEHGEFWMLPYSHLSGQGCPKCAGRNLTRKDIVERFKKENKKGDYYIYDFVNFKNMKTEVCIICPKHGEFWQKPSKHLQGHGCPKCARERQNDDKRYSFDKFEEKANLNHNHKYIYIRKELNSLHDKITAICPKHGEFTQLAYDHLNGHGCPKCGYNISIAEDEIVSFIKDELKITNIIQRNKKLIYPYEIDIFLPDYKIGIEYDGLIWHSEKFGKDKYYHLEKLNKCNEQGINLINIFEDEYNEHKEIVFEKIRHVLKKDEVKEKIYARKCIVKEINKNKAEIFLNNNHIQGYNPSTVYIGAYYNNKLVAVMTFKRENKNSDKWELNRFATDINKHCVGIGGKLFSFFINTYNPSEVKSFADRRWTLDSSNNLYTKLGFEIVETLLPDYSYVTSKGKRVHKFNMRKNLLIKRYPEYNLTTDMTEKEMVDKLGIYRIWDCGKYKYVWKQKNGE